MCALIPSFAPKLPQWRGNTSSADMNENFEEILYDLNTIFSEASNIVIDINQIESKIRHEVEAIKDRVYAVSGIMTAYDRSASGYKMAHEDFYLTQNIVYPESLAPENRCVVNTEFGTVSLPISNSFSKMYTIGITDGDIHMAPDITTTVTPLDETGYIKIEGTSELQSFDGSDDNVWERKVKFSRDFVKSETRCALTVGMPSMTNPYVNRVFVKPYPEGTVDIQAITYDTTVSQDNILPTFPVAGLNSMRSSLFSFDNIQPTKFTVYLRQRNSTLEDDYKTFTYGLKELGIEKAEYRSTGSFGIKFDLPDYEPGLFKQITSLRTGPDYDNIQYTLKMYATDTQFQNDQPIWTSNNPPIMTTQTLDVSYYGSSSIWVLVTMNQADGESGSPLFDSLTLTYTTV